MSEAFNLYAIKDTKIKYTLFQLIIYFIKILKKEIQAHDSV